MTLLKYTTLVLLLIIGVSAIAAPSDSLECTAFTLSDDGKFVMALVRQPKTQESRLYGWSTESGQLLYTQSAQVDYISQVTTSPTNNLLATAGENAIKIWNYTTGTLIKTLPVVGGARWLQFSPSGKYLVVARQLNYTTLIVRTADWEILHTLDNYHTYIRFNKDETLAHGDVTYNDERGFAPMIRAMTYEMSTGRFIRGQRYQINQIDSIKGVTGIARDSSVLKGEQLFEAAKRETYYKEQCDCGSFYLTFSYPYFIRWQTKTFKQTVIRNFKMDDNSSLIHMDCNSIFTSEYKDDGWYTTRYDISKGNVATKTGSAKIADELIIESIDIYEPYQVKSNRVVFVVHDPNGQYLESIDVYHLQRGDMFPGKKSGSYRVDWK